MDRIIWHRENFRYSGKVYQVEVEVNLTSVLQQLAYRATHSKGRKATAMASAIKARPIVELPVEK